MFHKRPLDTIRHQLPIRHVSFKSRKQYRTDTGTIGRKALLSGFPAPRLLARARLPDAQAPTPLGDPAHVTSNLQPSELEIRVLTGPGLSLQSPERPARERCSHRLTFEAVEFPHAYP